MYGVIHFGYSEIDFFCKNPKDVDANLNFLHSFLLHQSYFVHENKQPIKLTHEKSCLSCYTTHAGCTHVHPHIVKSTTSVHVKFGWFRSQLLLSNYILFSPLLPFCHFWGLWHIYQTKIASRGGLKLGRNWWQKTRIKLIIIKARRTTQENRCMLCTE